MPLARRPAPKGGKSHAEKRRHDDLADGAGHGQTSNGKKVGDGKVKAHAEHEQDDTEFGQLAGQCGIGDEARNGPTQTPATR